MASEAEDLPYVWLVSYYVQSREQYGKSLTDSKVQEIMVKIAVFTEIEPIRQFDELIS